MPENNFTAEKDLHYHILSQEDDSLYRFYIKYSTHLSVAQKYASGTELSMVPAHTLSLIQDHPGITTTQIAETWGITKGAVSQTIKKLENQKLITKEKDSKNSKIIHLFVTQVGAHISLEHKLFDVQAQLAWRKTLLEKCTSDDLAAFYKVLRLMTELM